MNRNNTSFSIRLFEHLRSLDFGSEYSFLKYYQNIVREYFKEPTGSRGILVAHTMGMGKTITAIAIAMDAAEERPVIVLLTKSLQTNFRESIKKYVKWRTTVDQYYKLGTLSSEDLDNWVDKHFSFVSMNASNMITQMSRAAEGSLVKELGKRKYKDELEAKLGQVTATGNLDGKMLIVDEAHNLFRAITNGSKNGIQLYEMVMRSRDLRVVFLTGTPISNDPFELVPCFNMLGDTAGRPILPETYKEFYSAFVDQKTGTIKNREKFQNRIMGLVSYVTHKSNPGAARIHKEGKIYEPQTPVEFPEQKDTIIEYVPMDPEQYVIYQLARDKEQEESKRSGFNDGMRIKNIPTLQKPKLDFSSSYRVKSRQLSNYCPPEAFRDKRFSDINPYDLPENSIESPKIKAMLNNIEGSPGLGIVYSQFVGIGGLGILARYLEMNGWERIAMPTKTKIPKPKSEATTLDKAELNNDDNESEPLADEPTDDFDEIIGEGDEDIGIRDMKIEDIPALKLIDEEKNINRGKNYTAIMLEPMTTYVAVDKDDYPVGYITLEVNMDESAVILKNISVATEHKNKTIQADLFSYIMDNADRDIIIILNKHCPFFSDDIEFYSGFNLTVTKDTPDFLHMKYSPARNTKGSYETNSAKQALEKLDLFMEKNYGFGTNGSYSRLAIRGTSKQGRKVSKKNTLKHIKHGNLNVFCLGIQEPYFINIKRGLKTIEGRLNVGKFASINPGDLIVFNNKLTVEVTSINKYDTFFDMLEKEDINKVLPGVLNAKEGAKIYRKYYSAADEKKNGVVAIHIAVRSTDTPGIPSKVGANDVIERCSDEQNKFEAHYSIRPMKLSDAPEIAELYNNIYSEDITANDILKYSDKSFVIESRSDKQNEFEERRLIGAALYSPQGTMEIFITKSDIKQSLPSFIYAIKVAQKSSSKGQRTLGGATAPTKKKKFAIISGEVDVETRQLIQDTFNSKDNARGGILDLILLSSTGAEGLDLKNIRHIHIMEPYWNYARIAQIIARGVRNDSHKDLSPEEKNVQPFVYLAVPPKEISGDIKSKLDKELTNIRVLDVVTTDVELYSESLKNQLIVQSFSNSIWEVSIECMLNGEKNCRVCNPDNAQLFTSDFATDLRAADPCKTVSEKKVTAKEIIIDGDKYYYIPDPSSVYDYRIYEYDKSVAGYKQMPEDIPLFQKIVEAILILQNSSS